MRIALFKLQALLVWWSFLGRSTADFTPKIAIHADEPKLDNIYYFDDSSNILLPHANGALISFDDGVTLNPVKEFKGVQLVELVPDPFRRSRVFMIATGPFLYVTDDKGKSWTKVDFPASKRLSSFPEFQFHAHNPDLVLISFKECEASFFSEKCTNLVYYTNSGFKKKLELVPLKVQKCIFSQGSANFKKGPQNRIICSADDTNSFGYIVNSKLWISDDFFKTRDEVKLGRSASGNIIDVRVEQEFVLAVVKMDKFNEKGSVSMYTSEDAEHFLLSDLHVDIKYGLMGFLESSPLSLIVFEMSFGTWSNPLPVSTLFKSDSRGIRFTKMRDNVYGAASKIQNVDGAWIIATEGKSENDKRAIQELDGRGISKNLKSMYTFNNGHDWNLLAINDDNGCKTSQDCSLHALLIAEDTGEGGRSTGPTPGILLAIGNKGKTMGDDIKDHKTWVSHDGGASWSFAIDEPCAFSFGDQGNVIVAIPSLPRMGTLVDKFYFSLDQGHSWTKHSFEKPFIFRTITTMIDGTSQKFVTFGYDQHHHDKSIFYALDFSNAFGGKTCKDLDFEKIYARVAPGGEPLCVYGRKEWYMRRKQLAQCFVNKLYKDIVVNKEPCECTAADFECSPEFKPADGKCVPDPSIIKKKCTTKSSVLTLADKRKSTDNSCRGDDSKFINKVKVKCSDYRGDGSEAGDQSHAINSKVHHLDAGLESFVYVPRLPLVGGENIIVLEENNRVVMSENAGKTFVRFPVDIPIAAFLVGQVQGQVILVTGTETILVSEDAGNTFRRHTAPTKPSSHSSRLISFHKTDQSKFIWYGGKDCQFSANCKITAFLTVDGGKSFEPMAEDVILCDFVGADFDDEYKPNKDLIYCIQHNGDRRKLVSSTNKFKDVSLLDESIVGYAITGRFVVLATVNSAKNSLSAKVTVDGSTWAAADFPPDFHVDAQQAYTILDALSGAVFMHVTQETRPGLEYGAVLKLNSNGTSYVLALETVNRNTKGFVDFDRIQSMEGVIIANVVINAGKHDKKLKTKITHNDGAEWDYLKPPMVDSLGKKFDCSGKTVEKCSLNLHGYTERTDFRNTFGSSSATGILIGVGNVGETLGTYEGASTFMTRDGGITWKEIAKGVHLWEYGDRGTILVLVKSAEPTSSILYSLDDGTSWKLYEFSKEKVSVVNLATSDSDDSRQFVIFARKHAEVRAAEAIYIDFTKVFERQCQLDLDHPDKDDYEFWSPSHPNLPNNCLFGHELKYLRRAAGHHDCFIGKAPLKEGFKVTENCSCTRRDFECDYNYYRDIDNTCKLVKGLSPSDREKEVCGAPNQFQYFEPTGYRKIPLSTCVGGKQFDSWNAKPCPGKKKQFDKYYGREMTASKLAFLILAPIALFLFSVWFVYDRGIRRNGGFERLGQIRLDEEDSFTPIENNAVDKVVNTIVKGGIIVAIGLYATFKTARRIDRMLLDKVTGFIFRNSVGRRRQYVRVPGESEGEPLYDDNESENEEAQPPSARLNVPFQDQEGRTSPSSEEHNTPFHDEERDLSTNDLDDAERERLFDITGSDEDEA